MCHKSLKKQFTPPPFLAPAKVPSASTSCQASWPWASNSRKKAHHALSHTSASCHSCSRCQQVLAEGYPLGRSFQRASLRKTHKIPSNTSRLGMRVRSPLGERCGSGNSALVLAHWASGASLILSHRTTPYSMVENTPKPRRYSTYPYVSFETSPNSSLGRRSNPLSSMSLLLTDQLIGV